ncbi:MAG: pseudaminic acid cytidylyltransferase [Bacteroidota bacterium]
MTNNLCIIPARGGSKRIPRKNIKDFLGKPIIAYSIEAALESGLFEEVMVSTDDKEIAEVAKQYGATVPFIRSDENANDFATLADVVDEVKEQFIAEGRRFNNICLILPTAPLIKVENIQKGYSILIKQKADSVRPLARYSYPIQRAVKMQNGQIEMFNPEFQATRSQDLEPAFHDAGQFYWMKFDCGLRGQNKFGFEIPELEVQDIDTEEDWKMAELKYLQLRSKK